MKLKENVWYYQEEDGMWFEALFKIEPPWITLICAEATQTFSQGRLGREQLPLSEGVNIKGCRPATKAQIKRMKMKVIFEMIEE